MLYSSTMGGKGKGRSKNSRKAGRKKYVDPQLYPIVVACITIEFSMKTKDIVHKSQKCTQNEHLICEGVIIETIDGSKITKICECQCHDSSQDANFKHSALSYCA